MSEKYPEFDENDPKTVKRLKFLEETNRAMVEKCPTWAAFYTELHHHANAYYASPCKSSADFTITLFNAFAMAMEDLPEEGDIQVIICKMNEIIIMHPERTGIQLLFGSDAAEAREVMEPTEGLTSLVEALQGLAHLLPAADADDTPTDKPQTKRVLH